MIEADKSGAFLEKENCNQGKDDQCYSGRTAEKAFDNGVRILPKMTDRRLLKAGAGMAAVLMAQSFL